MTEWLEELYAIVNPDEAIDVLFDHIDTLLLGGQFDRCNDVLEATNVQRITSSSLLVAMLSITKAAEDQLPGRQDFVQRVRVRLKELVPERAKSLLRGLV